MNSRNLIFTVLFCVALILVVDSAEAQNKRTGTAAASELLIPVGGRDFSMGGSSISNSLGVEAMYWNPAGLGRMTASAEGMFSHMSYIADIGVNYGAVAGRFGEFGVLGLSVKSVDIGDIPLTTVDDPEGLGGRTFSPTFFILGLSYARQLTDAIAAGGTVKVISETIDRVSASGFAFDIGIQYHNLAGLSGLQLGVTVKNIGPQMQYDGPGLLRNATSSDGSRPEQKFKSDAASFELPSQIEIGLGYVGRVGDNMPYALTGTFTNDNLFLDQYKVGGEYGWTSENIHLFGRVGGTFLAQSEAEDRIFGVTFGGGLTYRSGDMDITIDYAFRQVDLFDNNNVISLKFGF